MDDAHSRSVADVLAYFHVQPTLGLSQDQVQASRALHGPNGTPPLLILPSSPLFSFSVTPRPTHTALAPHSRSIQRSTRDYSPHRRFHLLPSRFSRTRSKCSRYCLCRTHRDSVDSCGWSALGRALARAIRAARLGRGAVAFSGWGMAFSAGLALVPAVMR